MVYSPDYTISLAQGKQIPLLFNTWAYKKFCQSIGIELEELLSRLSANQEEQKPIIRFSELTNFFLCAAESYCRYNNQQFTQTDLDACGWVDALGGVTSPKLREMAIIAVSKLINVNPEALAAIDADNKGGKLASPKKKH
jgi:hypothetical protein